MIDLKIKNSKPIQDNFLGNGVVYHGYAGMPDCDGRVYSEELCELEAKRAADMKLKIVRTFYGWWAWEPETKTWNWENNRMRPFYRWLQRMKDANITVALNTGWCSPGDINSTYWNGISPFTVEGDWKNSVQNYADWVSETLHQLVEIRGFTNIKILVLFTEPQHLNGESYENMHPYECWADAARAVHNTLKCDGRRDLVKLMGPNEGSTTTSEMLKWTAENCADVIDIFSSHTYLFDPPITSKYIKSGKCAVSASIPGGRGSQTIKLEPNCDYILSIDALFESKIADKPFGDFKFGLFSIETADEKEGFVEPLTPAVLNGISTVSVEELTDEYKTFKICFNSGNTTEAILGFFDDIKTMGVFYVDNFCLTKSDSNENLLYNSDFSNYYDSWCFFYAGATISATKGWCKWTKTGMQYVPKGKQFCFDEYNAVYDRDNSRASHGADIVMAAISFMNCGVATSMLWTAFDQQWPNSHTTNNDSFIDGDHRCGIMPTLTRSLVPYLSYYAFSLLSRYVTGEGTKVYEGIGDVRISTTMSVSKDGDITVVVVNDGENALDFNISFEKPINKKLNRHRFDPAICKPDKNAEIIPTDAVFDISDKINDSISAYGVTVYTTIED